MTIAVQGDWGTGKTSLMKQLEDELKKKDFDCTLWFDTWQFAVLGEQDRLLMDLLEMLCWKLAENCSGSTNTETLSTLNRVMRFVKRVGRASAIGSISLLAETVEKLTGIPIAKGVSAGKEELEKLDKEEEEKSNALVSSCDYVSYAMQVSELRKDLEMLIDGYLGMEQANRLYIFIDDLDRLEPVRAVELLEGIKNFLEIPRCVFMIAIDTKVVMEGLLEKYGNSMTDDKRERFFDKIIQASYELQTHNYDMKEYVKSLLSEYKEQEAFIDKYTVFLKNAGIHNLRAIKRGVITSCVFMESYSLHGLKNLFYLFVVKIFELEERQKYREILQMISSYDNTSDNCLLLDKIFEYCKNNSYGVLSAVMKEMKIEPDKCYDKNVNALKEFINYIAGSVLFEGGKEIHDESVRFEKFQSRWRHSVLSEVGEKISATVGENHSMRERKPKKEDDEIKSGDDGINNMADAESEYKKISKDKNLSLLGDETKSRDDGINNMADTEGEHKKISKDKNLSLLGDETKSGDDGINNMADTEGEHKKISKDKKLNLLCDEMKPDKLEEQYVEQEGGLPSYLKNI